MAEIIRFVPKSERERLRLIRRARANYDHIFPPADLVGGRRDRAPASHVVTETNARPADEGLLS
jgi:hypothetical protein